MKVDTLVVYPIKSCRGVPIEAAQVVRTGFMGDREYMLVDADGGFVTQRTHPQLATISVEMTEDGLKVTASGWSPLHVSRILSGDVVPVSIHGYETAAVCTSHEVDGWFSDYLSMHVRLVRSTHGQIRRKPGTMKDFLAFQDSQPLLVVSQASVEALARGGTSVDIARFRANIVLTGIEHAFSEDSAGSITFASGVTMRKEYPCPRCKIVNVDQRSGRTGEQDVLSQVREWGSSHGKVCLGSYYAPVILGTIRHGDSASLDE